MAPNDPNVGQLWDTDILSGSQSFPRTFLKVGTFPYFCRIQGTFMSGVISVVDKAPLPASLPAPTLISPPDGSTGEDPTPTFEWSQVADPRDVTYTLEIGFGTADFKNVAFTADGILATQFTLSIGDALAPGDYIWHVRAVDGAGNTDNFSTPSTFTIVAAVPSPITINIDAGEPVVGFFFNPDTILVKPGQEVTFAVTNIGSELHTFYIAPSPQKAEVLMFQFILPGATSSATITIPTSISSLYFYCLIVGHEPGGMFGTIEVR